MSCEKIRHELQQLEEALPNGDPNKVNAIAHVLALQDAHFASHSRSILNPGLHDRLMSEAIKFLGRHNITIGKSEAL